MLNGNVKKVVRNKQNRSKYHGVDVQVVSTLENSKPTDDLNSPDNAD